LLDFEASSSHSVTVRATSTDGSTQDLTLTIALTDVDEVAPAITGPSGGAGAAASSASIVENTTAVTQLTANEAVTWAITGGLDAAKFAIDTSGNLSFIAAPNYEAPNDLGDTAGNNTYVVVVNATDTLGNASTQTVTVTITNANEFGIVLSDSNAAANQVAENAANGSLVGLTALGVDGDVNQTVTYALSNDAGGRFQIDANTGVITVADGTLLDFEASSSHTVTVQATSSDGSTATQSFTISLTDVDEVAPQISGPSGAAGAAASSTSIVENTTTVTQLTASEAVTWTITGGADAAKFAIDASGNLSFIAAPNYEAPNDLGDTAGNNTYVVVVRAADTLGNASTQTVTVTVTNADEFGITLNDSNAAANQVAENAANGSLVGVTALGVDGDANQAVSYSLTNDAGGRFQIDASTGVITVANGGLLDFEASTSHTVTVLAASTDGSVQTQTFTIDLADVDEVAPAITGPSGGAGAAASGAAILENANAVTQLTANEAVTWTISGGADAAKFSIDAAGNLAFLAAPDYEAPNDLGDTAGNNTYQVVVRAADALGNASTQTVTVTVGNVGEFGVALSDSNPAVNEVAELSAAGSLVGITARGVDGDASQSVGYALTDDAGGRFQIDATTGVVTVANGALLDYEVAISHTITVEATSADGSVATQVFTIALTDVDENAPVISGPSGGAGAAASTASIAEGSTAVTQLGASEPVTWSISGGADAALFAVDAAGRLAFVAPPDFEAPADADGDNAYVVTLTATDAQGNASAQTVTVGVLDTNETVPVAPPATAPASGPAPAPAPAPADAVAIRLLESGPWPETQPRPELDPSFGFDGSHFTLPISAFTVPEREGLVFKSLAQGEFALEADSTLQQSIHSLSTAFRNILTQPAENAFQVAVRVAGESSLRVFRGIPDQDFVQSREVLVQVPVDAFIHSDSDAIVFLVARMADGSPLPRWLQFDPSTGKFAGRAPAGTSAELTVLVEARDRDGRHAEAVFRIRLDKAADGRAGLSEQLRSGQRETVDTLRGLQAMAARWLGAGSR
ncbi:MAG TPA: cadherin domain-containing protein, partial [Ramlibacter sp.]|uniref:cadherin domain-containing protein n=1 Tax=Ramlibacter sp. TaxID=1917967 RepID=UPI002ED64860